jgi:hypothetical protein
MGLYSGCAHLLIITLALSRGDNPRTSASPYEYFSQRVLAPISLLQKSSGGLPYLLSNHHVQVMLRLIDMRAHWHNAADTMRIRFTRPRARRMHDAVLGTAQKVRAAA